MTVTSEYYVKHVLNPLIHKNLIKAFGDNISKVFVHHDKSPVHVSKYTTDFMNSMTEKYGIRFIAKADIPVKGADCAPLDFFGFGYLKQQVEMCQVKDLDQLWKRCQRIWKGIRRETCADVYESWKIRCRKIWERHGSHVEQIKGIHDHKKPLNELN